MSELTISQVQPTVLFAREGDLLKQMVDVGITNSGTAVGASLEVVSAGIKLDVPLGEICPGDSTHQVAVPDMREPASVSFGLYSGGALMDEKKVQWEPGKHWQVYMVQVSHHDLGYTDLPSNVLREYGVFFDDMLRMCRETDEYPEEAKFRYTVEQAWSILHYLENRPPEVVEEMVSRIKEGRIEVAALFGNEVSEICGPEELIRLLYPPFRLKRRYGIPLATAELNDIPGLSWGLCTALAGAGIKYFAPALPTYFDWGYHVHGYWDETTVLPHGGPDAFWWEAQDGGKVLFWYGAMGASGDHDPLVAGLPDWLARAESQGYPYDVMRYWVMGGRRDNAPPLKAFCDTVRAWNEKWAYPHLVVGTGAQFFEHLAREIGPNLRTYRGELPNTDYVIGANSTAHETALNRVTHDMLLAAERFAVIAAAVAGYPYPAEILNEAYDAALLYDEHTWGIAHPIGLAEGANWAQKAELAHRAAALAQDVTMKALYSIADKVALKDEGMHLVVFNPLSSDRTDFVRAQFRLAAPCSRPMVLVPRRDGREGPGLMAQGSLPGMRADLSLPKEFAEGKFDLVDAATGQKVPFQIARLSGPQDAVPDAAQRWALSHVGVGYFYAIEFLAEDVPAMGYRTYRIVPTEKKQAFPAGVRVGKASIENRFYKVSLDQATGTISSIYDKELGRELVDPDAPHLMNQLIVRSAHTHEEYKTQDVTISRGCRGCVSGSLVVTSAVQGCPQVTQEITLYANLKQIDLATRLLKDSTPLQEIYIAFPFGMADPKFKYESALSVMEPGVDQFPGSNTDYYAVQHWASVCDGEAGVTLTALDAAMMEFGGLWPGYVSQAHHAIKTPDFGHEFLKPGDLKKGHIYSYVLCSNFRTNFRPVQTGETLFRYSITSGKDGWWGGRARDFGWAASLPLVPVYLWGCGGEDLPHTDSFCRIDASNVVLLALKRAEDGDGLILRLWEVEGEDTEVVVHLPFVEVVRAWETNLVEESRRPLPVKDGSIAVPLKAWSISTVRILTA